MPKIGKRVELDFRTIGQIWLLLHGQIDETIIEQMHGLAIAKSSLEGRKIYYGIIDGEDIKRLIVAYPKVFSR